MQQNIAEMIVKAATDSGIQDIFLVLDMNVKGYRTAGVGSYKHIRGDVGDLLNAICHTLLYACVKASSDIMTRNLVNQGYEKMPMSPVDFILAIRDCQFRQEDDKLILY